MTERRRGVSGVDLRVHLSVDAEPVCGAGPVLGVAVMVSPVLELVTCSTCLALAVPDEPPTRDRAGVAA